jgi:predicted DNA binding CopG/RHH family protein
MKKFNYALDSEEQEILYALESGALKALPDSTQELKKLKAAAMQYGNKAHRVNIRLTEWDYRQAQEKALREGIPYATLISSIVHKFFTGQLVTQ